MTASDRCYWHEADTSNRERGLKTDGSDATARSRAVGGRPSRERQREHQPVDGGGRYWLEPVAFRRVKGTEELVMLSDHPVFPILLSTDMEASKSFYRDTLGMDLVREDVFDGVLDRMVFRTGNAAQFVVSLSTVGTSDTQTQMAWRVPDVRAEVAELRARGVRIEEYSDPDPVTVDGVADMGHSWVAWFVDPSRNVVAVVEPKP